MFLPEAENNPIHEFARQLKSDAYLKETLLAFLAHIREGLEADFVLAAKTGVMHPDKLQNAAMQLGRVNEIRSLEEMIYGME